MIYFLGFAYLKMARNEIARQMLERASALGHRRARRVLGGLYISDRFGIRYIPRALTIACLTLKDVETTLEKTRK